MTYKSGEVPQKNDEVLGSIDGAPARGRVLAVRENGDVLVTRRAPYKGPHEPIASEHHEVPSHEFSLVLRPAAKPAAAASAPPRAERTVKDATQLKAAKKAVGSKAK